MKPNLSIATGLRRLSSDRGNDNPHLGGNLSPQTKPNQFIKTAYGDPQSKKNIGNSLKGLLSPVDYKLVEPQTVKGLRLEEENPKPSPKGSARIVQTYLNGPEQGNDMYSKTYLQKKKRSFDGKLEAQQCEEPPVSKTKTPSTNSLSSQAQARCQPSSSSGGANIYLKDVEYIVNPMFSPLNGPPKSQKGNGQLEGKLSLKGYETYDNTVRKESHSAKITPKGSLNEFFDLKRALIDSKGAPKHEDGSSEELQPGGTKSRGTKENKGKVPDGKKSPSITISPRLEGYTNTLAYLGSNSSKQFHNGSQKPGDEFETVQTKVKTTMGSLYSRQREENQEVKGTGHGKSPAKKQQAKSVKREMVVNKPSKQDLQAKAKKYEPYMKEEEEAQARPRTTKLSDPNIQKDINSSIFSAFNSQSKRNSAAQIYSPSTVFESNLQSNRSEVDRSEKQREEQRNYRSVNPKEYCSGKTVGTADIEIKLSSEGNQEEGGNIVKKGSIEQGARVMMLRKQVQEKRSNREFKSADQNLFDMHYVMGVTKELSSTKQGSDLQNQEPDTTYTSVKHGSQTQLSDIFTRVNRVLEMYQRKEKTWEEEKRKLLAEIQVLRSGKQVFVKGAFV